MKKSLKPEPVVIVTKPGHKLTIIRQFCKSCEICVSFCPKDVLCLETRTLKVTACNPDQCIGCKFCEWYCPDLAIFVEPAKKTPKVAAQKKAG
jgi:2-oxoglutarate ferredoxin oxidoreductase subunit delta